MVVFRLRKIVARDPTENEPRRPESTLEGTADLRFLDAWIIAYGEFDDTETADDPLKDQFHCPTVRRLLQFHSVKDIRAGGAERTEVADLQPVELPN